MCKRFCKIPGLQLNSSEWRTKVSRKPSRCHWVLTFMARCIWCVWMARDMSGYLSGIEYAGFRERTDPAIDISGVDFLTDHIKAKHQALSASMQYQCNLLSEDVLFAFQFNSNDRPLEDNILILCDGNVVYANAKVVHRSEDQIMCTEEYDGALKQVVRSKAITIKAIDVDEWRQIEYSTEDPKEACTIQHAIDILELKWFIL